ncbi:related to positive activator of transcription [Fusarium fujikuroi]|nr:related to positive activator of transcription [Fusarium fujikuroi]
MDNEMNTQSPQPNVRQRKKILNACVSCRNRKLRCSGRDPCERCVSRKEPCVYEEKERRVTVSADYLDQLHAHVRSLEAQLQASQNRRADASSSVQDDQNRQNLSGTSGGTPQGTLEEQALHSASAGLTNTLVTSEPQIKVHRYGHAAYLGHSSTLCFSRNVRNLLQRSSPIADPGSISLEREDTSYATALPPIALDLATISLPSLSYAEYLTNTVSIHTGSLYSLFDPVAFLAQLREFYDERTRGAVPDARLWHVQMLLVLAFGKSILTREHSESGPSGMVYFTRAIEAMSDIRRLYEDPLLSIEILCLASLFMHATDLLQESYVIALRIAVTKIMNVSVPEAFQPANVEYQRRLWWTVYCIDRKSAAMLGSTLLMRDEDISIPFPKIREGDECQNTFSIHVTLSSHLGKILDDLFLPYDIDALFSAAFALVLIDIIRPANELLWDLSQVMHLIDEYVSRHIAPAQAYRSDLLQILELHTKLRNVDMTSQVRTNDDVEAGSTSDLAGFAITYPTPAAVLPDPVWSPVRHGSDASAPTHLETIRSVIDNLDVDGANMFDTVMLDGDWMWELDNLWGFV